LAGCYQDVITGTREGQLGGEPWGDSLESPLACHYPEAVLLAETELARQASAASLLPRRSRRLWQPPARGAVGRPRNPRESLPFDMAELIERSISDWYGAQPPGTPSPEVESVGGFIVAELNRRELRYFNGLAARFQDDPDSEAYRLCVMFALDFWRIAVS